MVDDTNRTKEELLSELETLRMQLQESEKRFRDFFVENPDGILVANVETSNFYMANPTICQMLGYTESEIILMGIRDIHPEKDLPMVFKEFEQQAHGLKRLAREFPVKRKDGSVFYADINTTLITLDGKHFVLGIFRDVTELRKAQQALMESEEKYRVLVESASEAITVLDAHGIIKFANARVSEHFGVDLCELVGKTMWDLFPESAAGQQMDHIKQVIRTSVGLTVVHSIKMRGQEKWFESTLVPIRSLDGKVIDVMVIARDVTELKKTRDELSTFHRRMMQTERLASVGTLSAMVAHELNQPLTVIKLSVQNVLSALNANQSSDTFFEDLNECLRSVENAADRVGLFRGFARGIPRGEKEEVLLSPLIDKTLRLVEQGCKQARLAVTVEGLEGLPRLQACEQDLEQLFFILIENSIQASDCKTDHHLAITGSFRSDCIEVRLADDCGGIAREHLDEIFKLFFTVKPRSQGTGLGLCIAERIVTEMDGKITVNNDPGQGVAFCVSLPVQSDSHL